MSNPVDTLFNNLPSGKIVVNADEWTLSNTGFTQAPDTATFVTNIAKWFTGGRSTGIFHAYSTNFGLTESILAQTMANAGYTWTVGTNIKVDLPTLLTFDGIFLCADSVVDNRVLIDYVKAGGNVYLGVGALADAKEEGNRWNTFLNAFGLQLAGVYNEIRGNQTVNSSHPIFAGVKAIYQANSNPIVSLDPASPANQIILTHENGQGLIGAFAGNGKTNTLSFPPPESSQTPQIGKIVVNADEFTLSNAGFTQAPDTATFVTNIAKWFTGGRSTGKFHAYSTNFGLTEPVLAQTMAKAGYTWTVGKNIKFDLPTLLTFDGIFLSGDLADNQVLIDYVKAGGNVYLGAGTGSGGPQQEADRWNTFLNAFGLKLLGVYNGISGNQSINSSHPIFAGVKALYQNNGNSIVDLDPASPANQIILTHANGQGLIAASAGIEKTNTLSFPPPESSQTPKIGKIVVNADEWTLSNTGFTQAPDTATFVTNIAKWFTGGRSTGKFHAYSTNFGLTEPVLAQTIAKAGYTWTVGKNIKFDLPTLLTFDGIFLSGDLADNQVLIDYVKAGGNVYLGAGTGSGGPQQEADRWNTFLNAFGLKLLGVYNGISGNQPVNSSHPIFAGVKALYQNSGNSIVASQANQIILTHATGQGLIAAFEGGEKTTEQPLITPSVVSEKTTEQPLVTISSVSEKTTEQPLVTISSVSEKTTEQPLVSTSVVSEKTTEQPLVSTSVVSEKTTEQPLVSTSVVSEKTNTYLSRPVAFKARNGQYLGVTKSGDGAPLQANHPRIKTREIFRLITLGNGKVALQAPLKQEYLSVSPDGNLTWVGHIREWEIFDLVQLSGNKVALKDYHGKYISIQQDEDATVTASGLAIKKWEILELIEMDTTGNEINTQEVTTKEKKVKKIKSKKRRKKENTIILEFGSQKKRNYRNFAEGRGRLMRKVATAIAQMQRSGEIDRDVQPVIAIIRQKRSSKSFWDDYY